MNSDIRISLSFKDHRKRKKLQRRLGAAAVLALLDLWLSAAESRPDGILTDMDAEDVAIDAGWEGDPQEFTTALLDIGFLDDENGVYCLHDWIEHNPWASGADARSNKNRFKILKRYAPEIHAQLKEQGVTGVTAEEYRQYTTVEAENTGASSPSPSPSPSPKPKPRHSSDSEEVRLSELLFSLIRERNPKQRKANIQAWAGHVDRMIRLDKRTPEEIEQVIRWSQAHSFWQSNILSTAKLREQFDKLWLQMTPAAGVGASYEPDGSNGQQWPDQDSNRWLQAEDGNRGADVPEARAVHG